MIIFKCFNYYKKNLIFKQNTFKKQLYWLNCSYSDDYSLASVFSFFKDYILNTVYTTSRKTYIFDVDYCRAIRWNRALSKLFREPFNQAEIKPNTKRKITSNIFFIEMWQNNTLAISLYNLNTTKLSLSDWHLLQINTQHNRRSSKLRFTSTNKLWCGLNILLNWLKTITNWTDANWLNLTKKTYKQKRKKESITAPLLFFLSMQIHVFEINQCSKIKY